MSRSYSSSLQTFSGQIANIIAHATKASNDLDTLESRLSAIQGLCINESFTTAVAQDKLLWNLWAVVDGTYQEKRRDLQYRASVIEDVDRYRNLAAVYISVTMQAFVTIDADLTELRDRLEDTAVGEYGIPVEVQLASIERTLVRLKEEMAQARVPVSSGSAWGSFSK